MTQFRGLLVVSISALLLAGACGSDTATDTSTAEASAEAPEQASEQTTGGIRLVSPDEAAEIQTDGPADLVVLDVRTPEEFQEGHLEGAIMIDFYSEDFVDQLAGLDPDQPYLLYCRSGNRSGQTTEVMAQLEFSDVAEIDGGIVAWSQAGLPIAF